jgi:hypothetical protein
MDRLQQATLRAARLCKAARDRGRPGEDGKDTELTRTATLLFIVQLLLSFLASSSAS